VKTDSEGLHAISNNDNPSRTGDIVFVHGLAGGSHSTWRHGNEGSGDHFFWPQELGKDLPQTGIWSVGYAAGFGNWFADEGMALEDRANNLALRLTNNGLGGRPIIFVTHSMGGLVIKEFVTAAQALGGEEWTHLVNAVRGIVFLGTPHHGSHMATVAKGFAVLLRTQEHVKQMRFAGKGLDQLHKRFMKWQTETNCPIEAYVETRGIARSG
jgi:pimeloyl-ACP methyl ester carboxylesterase